MRAVKTDCVTVFARFSKWFVVAALVLMTGAHWAALQTVAWTTMLAKNLSRDSFAQAVGKTFDGAHPCPLCKTIAAAKKSEKKSAMLAPVLKLEFPPVAANFIPSPPKPLVIFLATSFSADLFFSEPPVPPPRGCFI